MSDSIFLRIIPMILLTSCTIQDKRAEYTMRPAALDTVLCGINVGVTSENEIRERFKVLKSSGRFLYLDPKDPGFKNLSIEKAVVLLTETGIVESFNVSYKPQKIGLLRNDFSAFSSL